MTTISPHVLAEIDRRNREFSNASPAERRVLLARDVIKHLDSAKLIANKGDWVKVPVSHLPDELSLQVALLSDDAPTCQVCALGSLMVSCVLYQNQFTVADKRAGRFVFGNVHPEKGESMLSSYFEADQLKLIELAFEGSTGWFANEAYDKARNNIWGSERDESSDRDVFPEGPELTAVLWRYKAGLDSVDARLRAIMANIITNNGTFIP